MMFVNSRERQQVTQRALSVVKYSSRDKPHEGLENLCTTVDVTHRDIRRPSSCLLCLEKPLPTCITLLQKIAWTTFNLCELRSP
jgi:hypothetical protein